MTAEATEPFIRYFSPASFDVAFFEKATSKYDETLKSSNETNIVKKSFAEIKHIAPSVAPKIKEKYSNARSRNDFSIESDIKITRQVEIKIKILQNKVKEFELIVLANPLKLNGWINKLEQSAPIIPTSAKNLEKV